MDRAVRTLIHYEWKSFVRNKFQLLLIAVTFLFSLYAVYYGQAEIDNQRETIRAVTALEQTEFSQYTSSFKEELATLEQERTHDIASRPAYAWYRHGYHAILPPHDYSPLSIGQRDLFRFYYRLTGMSLHYQLFENELANPVNLMVGNFDLSFVIIYLFPLLIIAFCYGLFSNEKEQGTLALLQIQAISIRKIIVVRLAFYFVLITSVALLISLIGLISSGNPLLPENIWPAIAWIAAVSTYCAFWFSVLFMIISFRKSSAFNAISAAGCWLLFLILVPAVISMIVTIKYPISSTSLAGLTRRTSLENENDEQESREVIREFFALRPEYTRSDSLLSNNLMPKAYAAFTVVKDINNQHQVDHYNEQVALRNNWASRFQWLSPAVNTQEIMTYITQTDLDTFLHFQAALASFHKDITDFYFPKLFWDKSIRLEDYADLPKFQIPKKHGNDQRIWSGLIRNILVTAFLMLLGFVNMKKGQKL